MYCLLWAGVYEEPSLEPLEEDDEEEGREGREEREEEEEEVGEEEEEEEEESLDVRMKTPHLLPKPPQMSPKQASFTSNSVKYVCVM